MAIAGAMMNRRIYHFVIWTLVVFLLVLSVVSLTIGTSGPSLWSLSESNGRAVLEYRFFRTLLVIVAGSSLAASGASLQAIFRNPLADPHLFGISGGAAVGACIVIAFFSDGYAILPSVGAMMGGLAAFLVVFFSMGRSDDRLLHHSLLVGVLINSLAASIITLLKTTLPLNKTQSLLFWLVGHITIVERESFLVIIPLWLVGMASLYLIRGQLEILSFGMDETRLLGIDAHCIMKIAIVTNCIVIGNVVAFAGMIGFLGLVTPHLLRMLINANLVIMLPIASLLGAILLLLFDIFSRISFLWIHSEVPIGALAAFFLSPVIFLLLRNEAQKG